MKRRGVLVQPCVWAGAPEWGSHTMDLGGGGRWVRAEEADRVSVMCHCIAGHVHGPLAPSSAASLSHLCPSSGGIMA